MNHVVTLTAIALMACGRVGFDRPPLHDAFDPIGPIDPGELPPFGAATRVEVSQVGTDEDDVCLTADMLEIFFESDRGGGPDIWTARRASIDGPWQAAERIDAVSTGGADEHPFVTRDGLTLYYQALGLNGRPDIFISTRPDRQSSFPAGIPVGALNTDADDEAATTSASELVLMLSSTRGGGASTLYEARRSTLSAEWGVPVQVAELSTSARTHAPHLDDPGLVVYFQRNVAYDMFWSRRPDLDSPFGPAVPLVELDSPDPETDPWVSPDHRTIYFIRDINGDKDIYVATRPE